MRNKKILFISIFVFMIVLSIGAVSAEDADDAIASSEDEAVLEDSESTISGTVSGGVDVATVNPNEYTGDLSYDIPKDAKTIKSADVYVNIYGVRTDAQYGANVNTTIKTANGDTLYNESLCYVNDEEDHSIVHNVNDHVTKVYLNYMIHYDIKNLVSGLNGTKLTINVDSFKMANKSFDGKIKLIALVLAYNNDSTDESISYWINDNQLWTKSNVNLTFNTAGKSGLATLTNVVLSSSDGAFKLNDQFLGDPKKHITGNSTFQYNQWDVTNLIDKSKNTVLNVANTGSSLRNSLSVLTINSMIEDVSLKTEYANTCYAGTNNTLTITVTANKAGKYAVKLLADGNVIDEIEKDLTAGSNTLLLTDQTVRPVDESTVNGAENKKVNYTVEVSFNNKTVASNTLNVPLLYNGNLGKDLAYPPGGFADVIKIVVSGDIKAEIKDVGSYLGSSAMNRTDVWTINLDENSSIVKSFVYVPYNWFNPSKLTEDLTMFNTTFNGVRVTPVALYRDQGNLGGYGKYGYGVLIYDVTDLVNKSGSNSFELKKNNDTPAVYPSALVYMYNTTNSNTIKEIYIIDGADLLATSSSTFKNDANRTIKADSTIKVDSKLTSNAMLYVFAASAQANEGNVVFNGNANENVWSGTSSTTDLYTLDVTGQIKDTNSISFVSTGQTILALQQMIVLTKNTNDALISLAPEYTSVPSVYAGTNNLLTITIEALKSGKGTVKLYADGVVVNSTEIDLISGANKIVLIDPTIRPVNETTVNGAANVKVNYTVELVSDVSNKNESFLLPVLYNGNLGKDLAYPAGGYESFLNITINGDIVIDVKDVASYLGAGVMNREDVWTINLDSKSSIVKSYIYVPYNWFNPNLSTEDLNMFNTTFNGVKVTPVAFYRDQGNLGNYGRYGYGVLVYDVSDLTKNGANSFNLTKLAKTPAVYPSVLVYIYNTTGSAVIKNVYISNGADLLAGTSNNLAKRPVHADSAIDVTSIADTAKLYILASSAQAGEGNIVFNGQTYENVWNGTSSTTDLYALDITGSVKNSNNISFVATGSTILALQQIIVTTQKAPTVITAPSSTVVYGNAKNLVVTLKDASGNSLSNAKVAVVLNGKTTTLNTNANGQATLAIPTNLVPKDYPVTITFAGDDTHIKSTATAKVTVKKASVKLTAKKATFKAKKKSKKYTVSLKNNKGKAMKKVKLTLKVKGKTYKATTNAKGKATFNLKKLTKKGTFKAKITYKGDKYFNNLVKTVKIKVKK